MKVDDKKIEFCVSPFFVKEYFSESEIILVYNIDIINSNFLYKSGNIDSKELEKKVEATINSYDKKYIKIKSFDLKKCAYSFNVEKWLKDNLRNVSVVSGKDKTKKYINFKYKLPKIVLDVNDETRIQKYINKIFVKFINKNTIKLIENSTIKDFEKKLKTSCFNYKYSYADNKIIIDIKPEYVSSLMAYSINKANEENKFKKIDFDKSVYSMIKYNKKS